MKNSSILPRFPHQFLYFTGLRIRRMCTLLSSRFVPPAVAVYEKAQGFWISQALVAACELDLAGHLSQGPKPVSELAVLCQTDETNLYRLLRALAGEGIFRELPGRVFRNTRLSESLKEEESSIKYMILHQFGSTNLALFTRFTECIRTGEGNAEKVLGKTIFQYMDDHPDRAEIYNKAMDHSSGMVATALLSAYDFSGIRHLADIGGGRGILLAHILQHYPHMQGTLFDLPRVVEEARQTAETFDVQERLRIVPGDFSEGIPTGADAFFMKNILHAFDDEKCICLLKKIHAAMPPEGKLIILETVPAADNKPAFGKLADLLMMAGSVGGKERSREEFEALLHQSGLRMSKLLRTVAPFHVIEAVQQNMSV
ncbi:MAG: hypothetical protein K0B08_05740 [Bacteroidales bacterium]|nr:hypothetical protein [Bacteroidales bacterium]